MTNIEESQPRHRYIAGSAIGRIWIDGYGRRTVRNLLWWFDQFGYRGRHFPEGCRESVEEITERLYRQVDQPGWHLSPDGKYYIGNVTIRFPQMVPDDAVMMIAPEGGLTSIPVHQLTEASADDLINEWIRRQTEVADDGDADQPDN